jgi:acyl-coenzyme A synthetase/AMP-(fatty) acid ligase
MAAEPDPTPHPLDHLSSLGEAGGPALTAGGETLSYRELDQQVGRTAAALLGQGLSSGDRVATWMAKTVLACVLPLACARAGLVHVPINPVLKRAQAAHILADSGARLLIGNQGRLATLEGSQRAEARLVVLEEWKAGDEAVRPSTADPDDLAALLYTSGSTGQPKGVMLSHANLWLGAISVAHYLGLSAADRPVAAAR